MGSVAAPFQGCCHVQCSAVQSSPVQSSPVQCSAVQCSAAQCSAVLPCAVRPRSQAGTAILTRRLQLLCGAALLQCCCVMAGAMAASGMLHTSIDTRVHCTFNTHGARACAPTLRMPPCSQAPKLERVGRG